MALPRVHGSLLFLPQSRFSLYLLSPLPVPALTPSPLQTLPDGNQTEKTSCLPPSLPHADSGALSSLPRWTLKEPSLSSGLQSVLFPRLGPGISRLKPDSQEDARQPAGDLLPTPATCEFPAAATASPRLKTRRAFSYSCAVWSLTRVSPS